MNPYEPLTARATRTDQEPKPLDPRLPAFMQSASETKTNKPARNTQRWFVVVPIAVSCGCISAIIGFLYIELFDRAGEFREMIALGTGAIAGAVGGFVGLVGGVVYAAPKS